MVQLIGIMFVYSCLIMALLGLKLYELLPTGGVMAITVIGMTLMITMFGLTIKAINKKKINKH